MVVLELCSRFRVPVAPIPDALFPTRWFATQRREPSFCVDDLRLQLRVGVLPQVDEATVVTRRPLSIALRLIQLPQSLVDAGQVLGIGVAMAVRIGRAQVAFEPGDRVVLLSREVVGASDARRDAGGAHDLAAIIPRMAPPVLTIDFSDLLPPPRMGASGVCRRGRTHRGGGGARPPEEVIPREQ